MLVVDHNQHAPFAAGSGSSAVCAHGPAPLTQPLAPSPTQIVETPAAGVGCGARSLQITMLGVTTGVNLFGFVGVYVMSVFLPCLFPCRWTVVAYAACA